MEHDVLQVTAVGEEAIRNRLLRRVDWRFLLPDPNPQRSTYFAGERLARALRLVSAEAVPLREAAPESFDLAVVSNPYIGSLRVAFEALCPGGMFYGEWYSPVLGGPSKIKRQLIRAGFEEISFYWPWPELGASLFWLPLEAPAALDYFQKTRPPSPSFMGRMFRAILWKAWKVARWARLLVPVCVMASKGSPDTPGQKSLRKGLNGRLEGGRQGWTADYQPGSLHWLMLTGGLTSINKVVKYGFPPNEPVPSMVVKSARVPESIPALVREAENLDSIARLPGGGPANVPRMLFLERSPEAVSVGETVISGDLLYTHLRSDNYRSLALEATAWLGQLVKPETVAPRSDWWARIAGPALDAFECKYGRELGVGWVDRIKDRLLPLGSLPVVFEHRDFSPWNVLVRESGQLAVLDWESGKPKGLPGMDLIYFLTFLAFFQDGAMESGNFRPAYQVAQDPESFTGSVQAECFKIYFESIGLDPGIAVPLRTLAWTIHSLSVFPRLGRRARRRGAEEPGLFIQLLAEDLDGG